MENLPHLFDYAKAQFNQSEHFKPVGAFIFRKGIPISGGRNKIKTHPKYADGKNCYTIHAEMDALVHFRSEVMGDTICVYRETYEGKIAMARPCNFCLKYLIEAGIKKVIYTIPEYPYYKELYL